MPKNTIFSNHPHQSHILYRKGGVIIVVNHYVSDDENERIENLNRLLAEYINYEETI